MGENHGFWALQASGMKTGLAVCGEGSVRQSQLGGGWVFWVPRATVFEFWAAT